MALLHAIDAHCVVVEEVAALGGREAACRLVEAGVDGGEALAQAVDRVVAREHRAPRANGCAACASSTAAQSSRSSQACATATVGKPCSRRTSAMKSISPTGSYGSHS